MQQFLFIAGLAAVIFGLFLLFKSQNLRGGLSLILGILLVGSAYLSVYFIEKETEITKKEYTVRLVGSKTIGQSLMPNLIKEYLLQNNFHVFSQEEKQDMIRYSASRKNDSLNEIIHFEIQYSGSKKGLESLKKGSCEIAMSSNKIQDDLAAEFGAGFKAEKNELIIAYDALRLIGHPSYQKDIEAISINTLEEILQGKISQWNKLSPKKKGDIKISVRDENSGTFKYIQEHFLDYQLPDSTKKEASFEQFDYYEKIAKSVAEDSLRFGIVDFGIDSLVLQNVYTIGLLSTDKSIIYPEEQSIKSGKYPLSRPLYLYTRGDIEKNEGLKNFIGFCKSPSASDVIKKERFIPLR